MTEWHDPKVGDPVLVHGVIRSIEEGIATVEVYRSWPLGETVTVPVQCGALMSDITIPEEAIHGAAAALEAQEVDADDPRAWFRGDAEGALRTAAPLIVAAELERLADEWGKTGTLRHEYAGEDHVAAITAVTELSMAALLRQRASVLRGVTQP